MTVLSFDARRRARTPDTGLPSLAGSVTGTFASPTGSAGTFTGSYRLERLLDQFDHPAAAGVFTGELVDAEGRRIGVGSRRHTAAVQLFADAGAGTSEARMGPLAVNLLGFMVSVDEIIFAIPTELRRNRPVPQLPASAAELLRLVASTADDHRDRERAGRYSDRNG